MERLTRRANDGIIGLTACDRNGCMACGYSLVGCDDMDKALEKLEEYEDLEEQGLLLQLPCKVGDKIYIIGDCEHIPLILDGTMWGPNMELGSATGYYCPYELNGKCPHYDVYECDEAKKHLAVFEDEVRGISVNEEGVHITPKNLPSYGEIGEFIFLSKNEAEQALTKMKREAE
jgi:hypothetical protein